MKQLKKGDKAPYFSLNDQNGETVSLDSYKGEKILIYFYPKANTPGCTTQSCAVEKARMDFKGFHTAVIGISPDSVERQKKFADKYNLDFPLLSDDDHAVAEAYGVWGEKKMYGKKYRGIIRSSFLVNEESVIEECWYKVSPKNTVPYAMKILEDR